MLTTGEQQKRGEKERCGKEHRLERMHGTKEKTMKRRANRE